MNAVLNVAGLELEHPVMIGAGTCKMTADALVLLVAFSMVAVH